MVSQATSAQPKITLYWLNDSRAQRIAWLLEELGLEYNVKVFYRDADMLAPDELRKVHPLGKSPLVSIALPDDHPADPAKQEKHLVLAESGLIVQYLTEHLGRDTSLAPKRYRDGREGQLGGETDEWMRYQYYLHYPEGSLMPPLVLGLVMRILHGPKVPFFIRPITSSVVDKLFAVYLGPEIANHLAFLESQLETSPGNGQYLCGPSLTAADILMSYPLQAAKQRFAQVTAGKGKGTLGDNFPKVWAYLKRLEEEPGFKRAEARIKQELEKKR
ncbi:hypothetical protein MYCTH_2303157 [Thermothelomyces thermophilus ATCC 42464]|uniref:Glutathione S-transferase n=1 Tax=Thermothelomyces thermophilus (strain ATCC 42464 / BCRC 31852 / DSM 1799) TaxID=573729 RepID=G2QC17_THET4|nr:uncharacterized protein MYCTH_2303157 [Thermothelomyces thermophilus ATCC 42464]AEO57244.1 hypothetical protein MYCTH_2303157 [Thermothelomyces thermophilus ATCC 42464]